MSCVTKFIKIQTKRAAKKIEWDIGYLLKTQKEGMNNTENTEDSTDGQT